MSRFSNGLAANVLMKRFFVVFVLIVQACKPAARIKENPTFAEDMAPIIYKNCSPCHRPGEAGPFSLLSYDDVKKKAKTIAAVTQARYMPPWPADPSYSHFLRERVLTNEQIALIRNWVANGEPAGDLAKAPPPPQFPLSTFGTPDLVLKMRDPLHIPGDNKDRFMVIKIPYELPADRYVRAIEFVPGNRKLIHHMNGHIVQYDDKKKDPLEGPYVVDRESQPLEKSYDELHLLNDDRSYPELLSSVANYLPGGVSPAGYPDGIGGWKLSRRGAFLMRDIHYGPSPVGTEDQSYFNVFFTDKPPLRPTMDMQLLGKSMKAFAATPDGKTIPLIDIRKWDFRWQYFYTFPRMVKVPKGSTIAAIAVYDNTANNPNNPFSPPRTVIGTNGSMRVTDEMFQFIMRYLPYKPGDESISLDTSAFPSH